jgi:hypothetical protein
MKAARVHGADDVLASISRKFGLRGQYGPCAPATFGIATLRGRGDATSSVDISTSSTSSALEPYVNAEGGYIEELRDELVDEVLEVN